MKAPKIQVVQGNSEWTIYRDGVKTDITGETRTFALGRYIELYAEELCLDIEIIRLCGHCGNYKPCECHSG